MLRQMCAHFRAAGPRSRSAPRVHRSACTCSRRSLDLPALHARRAGTVVLTGGMPQVCARSPKSSGRIWSPRVCTSQLPPWTAIWCREQTQTRTWWRSIIGSCTRNDQAPGPMRLFIAAVHRSESPRTACRRSVGATTVMPTLFFVGWNGSEDDDGGGCSFLLLGLRREDFAERDWYGVPV